MSVLSNFLKRAAPIVAQFSPEPISRTSAQILTAQYANQEANYQKKLAEERRQRQEKKMAEIFGSGNVQSIQPPSNAMATQNAGQGGFFSGLSNFFRGAGEAASSFFNSGLPQIFSMNRPRGVGQQPAVTTTTNIGAQESQGSGSIDAGLGVGLPTIIGAARNLIKSPLGSTAIGTGAGLGLSMLGGDGQPMRITRKMKAQARSLLNMTGGNLALTADFLGISEQQLVFILLKRFRNDGPVVTKAALRKTKSTIRKLKNMCDMYDDLRPAARRRTPMRRAKTSTTLIKN